MKKSIVISVIMFLIMSIFTGSVNAASATVNIGVDNSTPEVGNTITITIAFSQPVGTASLNLNYNNSIVKYTGSSAWKATDRGTSVKLDYIDTDFENKTITSMTVTFEVVAVGTANFTASNVVISNVSGEELTANASGEATISVKQPNTSSTTNPGSNQNTNSNTNGKPNTNNKPSSNTNTNTNTNTMNSITTQTPEGNNTNIENTISEVGSNDNNQINDISNAEQNEIKSENEDNKPDYMVYLMIGIIVLAIIILIIVIICKIKNN